MPTARARRRRQRVLLLGATAAALALVLVGVVLAVSGPRALPVLEGMTGIGPDCTVEPAADGDVVELSTVEAEAAATAAAGAVRDRRGLDGATRAVGVALPDAELSEEELAAVARALTGRDRAALTCRHSGDGAEEVDRLDRRGLTPRAAAAREDLLETFGRLALGGFAPGGVDSGHMEGSAHYDGRAVDVFFRPVTPAAKTRGWAVAQYLVAHAERLEVRTVIYDGRIWTAWRAAQGWRDYAPDTDGRSRAVAQVLEHRDHVHLDVAD